MPGSVFDLVSSVERPAADQDDNNRKDAHRNGANGKVIMLNLQARLTREPLTLDGTFSTDRVTRAADSLASHDGRMRHDARAAHTSAVPNN
jgi:hypothetical protein